MVQHLSAIERNLRERGEYPAMVACWRRGNPYVPLDPGHPATRLRASVDPRG